MAYGNSLLLHSPPPFSVNSHPATFNPFGTRTCWPSPATTTTRVIATTSASTNAEPPHRAIGVLVDHSSGNGALMLHETPPPLGTSRTVPLYPNFPHAVTDPKSLHAVTDPKSLANALRFGGLDTSLHSYRENFVIRCYEVGMNRTASIETIANLLQEVACDHAQSVGFSTDGFATTPSMRKRRLIWVTTRMHIEVEEYPVWGDVIQIETWCQSEGKVGTRRDWLMTNVATGKLIGRATSTWVMMNQDTRRLSRITEDVRDEYTRYCPTTPRFAFPEENSSSLKKIPKLEDPAGYIRSGLMPRRGDLDMNQHVNNVTYIGWTLESMPQYLVDTHQLYRITLDYRRECKYEDIVESLASLESGSDVEGHDGHLAFSSKNGAAVNGTASSLMTSQTGGFEYLHLLRLAGTDVEINRGRSVWKKKIDRQ